MDAYKLTSEMATTEEYAQQNEYAHSLFVADYAVTRAVSWDNLHAEKLIFGKDYAAGSVEYTMRAPSGGSGGMFSFSSGTPIIWSISSGTLPDGLKLDGNTGGISGTPTAEETATFTVKAENSAGSDTKELSITITKDAPAEYTVTVTTEGSGTASASHAKAVAGTEITLTAMPDTGYRFKEWQVIDGGVAITNNKFTIKCVLMPVSLVSPIVGRM